MIGMTWPQYGRQECTVAVTLIVKVTASAPVSLTTQEAEVLSVLLARYPAPVPIGDFIEALWPNPNTEPGYAEVRVCQIVHRIRKKVGREHIEVSHRGYRLVQLLEVGQ